MPPKTTSSSGKAQGPSKQELEAINKYLAQRPDFDKLFNETPVETAPEIKKNSQGAKDAKGAKDEREGNMATSDHHKANLGPAIAENLPEPASKEELKKRSEELNK
ncbi:hypothetical protein DOTSEDRAFT_20097 [Dothistroma septosporum NZE10]|uniref:Uncharacterized protein n=1 Tax=Dothistroma septosporum (strain NZE10 / CBS 128990) TaxID=675120 RepID=N1Q4S6_DOTSN|nr:hypothetical protein DOTSEDRAFT_20097 [Dothistroma septosporum NZE10]